MKVIDRHVFLADHHVPHQINLDSVYGFIDGYKPTKCIIGGDFLNLEWASHWNEKVFKLIGWEKLADLLDDEIQEGKRELARLVSVLPKDCQRYYIPGNHESWLYWVAVTYPGLIRNLSVKLTHKLNFQSDLARIGKHKTAEIIRTLLDTDKFGFKVLDEDEALRLGKLVYIHGTGISGLTALKKAYPATNVVMGHLHTHEVTTTNNAGKSGGAHQYTLSPCLYRLTPTPGYLVTGSSRWVNGFWVADILENGNFYGRVKMVVNNEVIPPVLIPQHLRSNPFV